MFTSPDGLDIAGQRIVVRNCRIQNFDDSIAIKPLNGGDELARVTISAPSLVLDSNRLNFVLGCL
jgi:hypothetical protein